MTTLDIKAVLAVKDWLWPILDFLRKRDAEAVACLNRDSRRCCDGYCIKSEEVIYGGYRSRFLFRNVRLISQHYDLAELKWNIRGAFKIRSYNLSNKTLMDIVPESLRELVFGFDETAALPASLTSLDMGLAFNRPLEIGVLPSGLQKLQLSCHFNQELLPGVLPASLRSLSFGWCFNQKLPRDVLPAGLLELQFGSDFDQPLCAGSLPSGLVSLEFGMMFNQPVGSLPANLQRLKFGSMFNRQTSLPASLQQLEFGLRFRQPLHLDIIPPALRKITVCWAYPYMRDLQSFSASVRAIEIMTYT